MQTKGGVDVRQGLVGALAFALAGFLAPACNNKMPTATDAASAAQTTVAVAAAPSAPTTASALPPPPTVHTVVAREQNQPVALRADAANIYWVNHGLDAAGKEVPNAGSVMLAPKDGGSPVVIAAKQDSPTAVGVDAAAVYWTVSNGVRRAPIGGGSPTTLFALPAGAGMPVSLVVMDKEVLIGVLHMTRGGVYRVAKTGGGKPVWGGNEDEGFPAWGLAPWNTYVFVCNGDGSTLGRAHLSMHALSIVVEQLGGCHSLTYDSDAMYWGDDGGHVRRLPFLGTGTPELARRMMQSLAEAKDLEEVAVDDAYVYWTEKAAGRIVRVPKKGGSESVVVDGLRAPQALAVDDHYVYWAEPSSGMVSKAPKSAEAAAAIAARPAPPARPTPAPAAVPPPPVRLPGGAKCPPGRVVYQDCMHACIGPDGCCAPGCTW